MPIIKKIVTKDIGARPVLVEFQNNKLQAGQEATLNSAVYETQDGSKVVGITSDRLLYTGTLSEDEMYNNFILVYNKNKNKIRLIQADHCVVSSSKISKKVVQTEEISLDKSISELNRQFGSKKARRVTEQRQRLPTNSDEIKEELEKTVTGLKLDDSFLDKTVTENDSLYRPKINRDASTRDGVYNLEDLVPGYILDTLAPEAGQIMTMGTVDPFNLSPFPASSISKILMADASEEIQVRSITIFLYIHYLIKYMITPMKAVTKKFVACDKSADVNAHILDNFSVNSPHGRTRPLHIKDKALCFILVLAAIALNYEVDVQSLSKDLKIGVKKTLEVSRILAFNASSKDKNVVQLKLPLPEPVSFNPKRKRKTL
nr:DNA-directed RNA polymerase I subunit RPA49-like isoform X2 [Leptinotarsa decemlineata]